MMPAANRAKASSPAIGRKASAACAAVSILVTPCAPSVAAVVTMMKKAMRFEASHAYPGIDRDMPEGVLPRIGAHAISGAEAQTGFLGLLRGLPEEQVGADRRAEDGDDHQQEIAVERDRGEQRRAQHFPPRHMDEEGRDDIGEQRPGQELEIAGIRVVRHGDLGEQAGHAECQSVEHRPAADHEAKHLSHRGKIGGDIHRVGDHQQRHEQQQHRPRQPRGDIGREPLLRVPADQRADQLDRRHEGQRQRHGPGQRIAELGAGLRIGGDAARIVVGRARGQAGSERAPGPPQDGVDGSHAALLARLAGRTLGTGLRVPFRRICREYRVPHPWMRRF